MFRLLLPVFLVLGLFFYWKKLKDVTAAERAQRLKGIASVVGMLVAAAFAIRSGSWGWAAGGLLAILALRAIPYLGKGSGTPSSDADSGSRVDGTSARTGRMTRDEALKVFDLSEPFTEQEAQTRYRELMRGVHPDRGGSNHLAAQVNEAYRVLTTDPNSRKRG